MVKEPLKSWRTGLLLPLVGALLLAGCKPKADNTATGQPTVRVDSLRSVLASLNDSVDVTWREMLDSDAQKLRHIDTLLKRIEGTGQYDKALFNRATSIRASLAARRYERPEDLTSAQIDAYDAATDSLISTVATVYERLPNPERCPDCEALRGRIQETDEAVLPYRLRYDQHAEAYNRFLNQNRAALRQGEDAADSLRARPLFRLSQ
ncbi:MAG: hypothetical protein AVDCRST_MAG56-784 [uncultured Cytophagales bacterium]|uniref:LemA family protein n=1 Tax=uncultured Cytophagales bacterium TaxID=158755 RepID=A0A6J4HNM5_9SPHI|nr:MAG: hypothetical protein AVDCRST_MAG56-784 [uncultured Cytophagales bacterium]